MLRVVRDLSRDPVFLLVNCWTGGIVYCTCGTRLIPREHTRFDALTIPYFDFLRERAHGGRSGKTEAQREHRQAKDFLKESYTEQL